MKKAIVFFADGFEEVEALTVVDLLRRAGIAVEMVSVTRSLDVTGAHHIQMKADALFDMAEAVKADAVILPGGMPGTKHLGEHKELARVLAKRQENGDLTGAICAAPTVLGKLGLLRGKRACCYPGMEGMLSGAVVEYNAVSVDGAIITSRGVGTAIAFSLALVDALLGSKEAEEIRKSIVYGQA